MASTEPRQPRSRFYDGLIYSLLIDPMLKDLHALVAAEVGSASRVLDACCGTGALAARLATRSAEVVGVELSPVMVSRARRRFKGLDDAKVSIILGDVSKVLGDYEAGHFDAATIMMALHEMPTRARGEVLHELTRVATRVVCIDYVAPMDWNLAGLRNRFLELAAGPEHFAGFRDFSRRGGLAGLADELGLEWTPVKRVDGGTLEIGEMRRAVT